MGKMKILHAADLHLGKVFHEVSLLDDQKHILEQLLDELASDDYAALVIAGDIYDRSVPPAEATQAFSGFITEARRRAPGTAIFAIPGNHDSADRLSYLSALLREQNLFIACEPKKAHIPEIVSHNGEKAAFFSLPYLFNGALDNPDDEMPLHSQEDLAKEAARLLQKALKGLPQDVPAVLIAHLFARGGERSSSERIFVGTAEDVSASLFEGFAYVALGHLHKFQSPHERMYYSGSPLAYSFDEAGVEKCFIKAEIDTKAAGAPLTVARVPVKPLRRVTRLAGRIDELLNSPQYDIYIEDYIEIELTDDVLQISPLQRLRERFGHILSVKQGLLQEGEASSIESQTVEATDPIENFANFESYIYAEQDEGLLAQKKALFTETMEECQKEERSK